jgi:hypothetical protein
MSTKAPFLVESFVIIGAFDYDCTLYTNEILEFKIISMGRCKLRWFKNDKSPNPKSPCFNIRMEKTIKNQF